MLSPDTWYRAEIVPASIAGVGQALCAAYGVPADHFGAKGNTSHTYGYHRSRAWILNSGYSNYHGSDYSIQLAADKTGDPNWVSAFDFTPADWGTTDNRNKMIVLTKRLLTAAQAHDPRVAPLREFAGTLDGKTVVTYDLSRNAFKSPFDSTHLDHLHGSLFRSMAASNLSGLVAVLLGQGGREPTMLMAQVTGNPAIFLSDGFKYRGVPDYATMQKLQGAGVPLVAVGSVAELERLCGKPESTSTAVHLDDASLAAVEAAAKEGAAEGAGGPTIDEIEEAVDRQVDQGAHPDNDFPPSN